MKNATQPLYIMNYRWHPEGQLYRMAKSGADWAYLGSSKETEAVIEAMLEKDMFYPYTGHLDLSWYQARRLGDQHTNNVLFYTTREEMKAELMKAKEAGRVGAKGHKPYKEEGANDPVSPNHYQRGGIECREVIKAWDQGWNINNVFKYLCRAGFKVNKGETSKEARIRDCKKAKQYLEFELKALTGE